MDNATIDGLSQKVSRLKEEKEKHERDFKNQQTCMKAMKTAATTQEAKITSLQDQLQDLEDDKNKIKGELESIQEERKNSESVLNIKLDANINIIESLQDDIDSNRKEIAAKQLEIDQMKESAKEQKSQTNAAGIISQKDSEIFQLRKQIDRHIFKNKSMNDELRKLRVQRESSNKVIGPAGAEASTERNTSTVENREPSIARPSENITTPSNAQDGKYADEYRIEELLSQIEGHRAESRKAKEDNLHLKEQLNRTKILLKNSQIYLKDLEKENDKNDENRHDQFNQETKYERQILSLKKSKTRVLKPNPNDKKKGGAALEKVVNELLAKIEHMKREAGESKQEISGQEAEIKVLKSELGSLNSIQKKFYSLKKGKST